jgi:hypothetical protein
VPKEKTEAEAIQEATATEEMGTWATLEDQALQEGAEPAQQQADFGKLAKLEEELRGMGTQLMVLKAILLLLLFLLLLHATIKIFVS